MLTLSPIVLFVYNRPEHTRRTLESLRDNVLASDSELFVYSDGPRSDLDRAAVEEIRRFLPTIEGFKRITLVERESNLGLARSVISGVTDVITQYGRIIALEDDLVTSKFFLRYMNEALAKYEHSDKVMHVSGYMLPVQNPEKLPDTFFYRGTSCWGWGTWKRAWDLFEPDAVKLLSAIRKRAQLKEFDVLGSMPYHNMLKEQVEGNIDSWAIRWYASVFLNNGLCLHPAYSLVNNIGNDGTGIHSGTTTAFDTDLVVKPVEYFPDVIEESAIAISSIVNFYRSIKKPLYKRIIPGLMHRVRKVFRRKRHVSLT
jgi:hypothetical protein